jgi:hypothetical protein
MTPPLKPSGLARHDTLRSQTPVALLMVCAVAALVLVNLAPPGTSNASKAPGAPVSPVVPTTPATAAESRPCAGCGEVVAVRPMTASKFGAAAVEGGIAIDVRMPDGSLRTVRSEQADVRVGMRVQLPGSRASSRS